MLVTFAALVGFANARETVGADTAGHGPSERSAAIWDSVQSIPKPDVTKDVTKVAGPVTINSLSGSWYDPSRPGDGFFVSVAETPEGPKIVLAFFGFAADSSRVWLLADPVSPRIDGVSFTATAYRYVGAPFGRAGAVEATVWGSIEFTVSACGRAQATIRPTTGSEKSMSLVQLLDNSGPGCLDNKPKRAFHSVGGLSGAWYNALSPGDGYFTVASDQGLIFAFYGYDKLGEPLWLISEAYRDSVLPGESISVGMLSFSGGSFSNPAAPETQWGTLDITFRDCANATAVLQGADGARSDALTRVLQNAGSVCLPPGSFEVSPETFLLDSNGTPASIDYAVRDSDGQPASANAVEFVGYVSGPVPHIALDPGRITLRTSGSGPGFGKLRMWDPVTQATLEVPYLIAQLMPRTRIVDLSLVSSGASASPGLAGNVTLLRTAQTEGIATGDILVAPDAMIGRVTSIAVAGTTLTAGLEYVPPNQAFSELNLAFVGLADSKRSRELSKTQFKSSFRRCTAGGQEIQLPPLPNVDFWISDVRPELEFDVSSSTQFKRAALRFVLNGALDGTLVPPSALRDVTIACSVGVDFTIPVFHSGLVGVGPSGSLSGGLEFELEGGQNTALELSAQFAVDTIVGLDFEAGRTIFQTQPGLGTEGYGRLAITPTNNSGPSTMTLRPFVRGGLGVTAELLGAFNVNVAQCSAEIVTLEASLPSQAQFGDPLSICDAGYRGPVHRSAFELNGSAQLQLECSTLGGALGLGFSFTFASATFPFVSKVLSESPTISLASPSCGAACTAGQTVPISMTISQPNVPTAPLSGEARLIQCQGESTQVLARAGFSGVGSQQVGLSFAAPQTSSVTLLPRFIDRHGRYFGGAPRTVALSPGSGSTVEYFDTPGVRYTCPYDIASRYAWPRQTSGNQTSLRVPRWILEDLPQTNVNWFASAGSGTEYDVAPNFLPYYPRLGETFSDEDEPTLPNATNILQARLSNSGESLLLALTTKAPLPPEKRVSLGILVDGDPGNVSSIVNREISLFSFYSDARPEDAILYVTPPALISNAGIPVETQCHQGIRVTAADDMLYASVSRAGVSHVFTMRLAAGANPLPDMSQEMARVYYWNIWDGDATNRASRRVVGTRFIPAQSRWEAFYKDQFSALHPGIADGPGFVSLGEVSPPAAGEIVISVPSALLRLQQNSVWNGRILGQMSRGGDEFEFYMDDRTPVLPFPQ
ncbi:MAG: hypothetical protein KDJ14_03585 [Xanthomonadales bacterium]|nr:hypothetical protein [Xanthomonadales bacterium]